MTCNNDTEGEWDYNAWNLKIDEITSDSKCTLAFTGGMSKEEYQKYIEEGIATRRNTYRGKDLTEFFTQHPTEFYKQIIEGTFDDIYVGDYITSKTLDANHRKITWLVADIDNYLNTGENGHILINHHLTIIPAVPLMSAQMNETNNNTGGYVGSKMYKETLPKVFTEYIEPDFKNHVIEYSSSLTTATDADRTNQFGIINNGASSNYEWVSGRQLDLMSEMSVFGGITWSSSGYDTGVDNRQFAIFKLKPEFINSYKNTRIAYWLKDVASSSEFVHVSGYGSSWPNGASYIRDVRPRFLIG